MSEYLLFDALKNNPMFASLDEYAFQIVENYLSFKSLQAGEVLFQEGERGYFMAIVVAGSLDILKKVQPVSGLTDANTDFFLTHLCRCPYIFLYPKNWSAYAKLDFATLIFRKATVTTNNTRQAEGLFPMTRLSTIKKGDSIGEMAMIDELSRSATVRALERSGLIILPNKDFERILQDHPRIGIDMLKGIATKLSINLRRTSNVLSKERS